MSRQQDSRQGNSRQTWRSWVSDRIAGKLLIRRRDEGEWEDAGVPGVTVRRLFVDRESNRMTALFRMAAGASYPAHIHDRVEECMVLEGDLHVGESVLQAGDYQVAPSGSRHEVQSTRTGCLLFVVTSLSDELQEGS